MRERKEIYNKWEAQIQIFKCHIKAIKLELHLNKTELNKIEVNASYSMTLLIDGNLLCFYKL